MGFGLGIHDVKNDFFFAVRLLAGFFDEVLHGISTFLVLPKNSFVFLLSFCIVDGPRDLFDWEGQRGMASLGRPPDFPLSVKLAFARLGLAEAFLKGFRFGIFQPSASAAGMASDKVARKTT